MSIHIPPPPCHSALAIAHRGSGVSEYVLRETGQAVGSEDEGVVALWQGLLGCDEKGRDCEQALDEFWSGWEERTWD
ncbi:hypothetical protein CI109_104772 [Kwoniella shandongensis]|uniref:Uncharacterized protein n=1 Tax=Kwoniella shandongensis TaxID=1734106 RepID=A0AAJ8LKI6_9TREE